MNMDSLSLTGIDHYAISVRDFEASARWYKDIFGFEIINKWSNAWLVGRGNIKVGLFAFPYYSKPSPQRATARLFHFMRRGKMRAGLGVGSAYVLKFSVMPAPPVGIRNGMPPRNYLFPTLDAFPDFCAYGSPQRARRPMAGAL